MDHEAAGVRFHSRWCGGFVAARGARTAVTRCFGRLAQRLQLDDRLLGAIRQGLKETGYIEGRNAAIKYRSADGRFDRLPAMAAELVADPAAVIIALAPLAATAAKSLTTTIPIVFALGPDPVELGLVSSLNHPGGNVTGVTFFINSLGAKRLELLRQVIPSAAVMGFLSNPRNPTTESQIKDIEVAARTLGVKSFSSMPEMKAISAIPSLTPFSNMSTQ